MAIDIRAAKCRHIEGAPQHSFSRGELRFGKIDTIIVKIGLFVFFLLAATPLAAVFLASLWACFVQEHVQAAIVYGRYLDAVDSMIETEQLETALLGVTPAKNTYLYKQLPRNLPDGLRKNIAAANARNTVQSLSQRPRTAAAPETPVAAA